MIIPIRCFTCGKVLADKYDYYVAEAKKLGGTDAPAASSSKGKEKGDSTPALRDFDDIRTGHILDKLGLTRYCCRRHMIAHVDLIDVI